MKQEERFYFCWLLLSIAFRITEVIFLKLSRKKYCVEAETELKASWVEQKLSAVPHVQAPTWALGSACPLFQPGFVQELGMLHQKRTGTPAHQDSWKEMGNLTCSITS